MSETVLEVIQLANLPAHKRPLEGGIFCGVITLPDGVHYAVVKLDVKPEKPLKWKAAMDWAAKVGGQLPSRAIAALLFSVASDLFEPAWHWTNEPEDSSFAWSCYFRFGYQYYDIRSAEGRAVAVRLIPLTS